MFPVLCLMCFNSTMVRLKAKTISTRKSAEGCFNSTMIRLKAPDLSTSFIQIPSFNSTMVRLKDGENLDAFAIQSFQFHYGTIKSYSDDFFASWFRVSIPLWYD